MGRAKKNNLDSILPKEIKHDQLNKDDPRDILHALKKLSSMFCGEFNMTLMNRDDTEMMQALLSYMGALLAFSELYDIIIGHGGRKKLTALLQQSKDFSDFAYVIEIYSNFYPCHRCDNILKTLHGIRGSVGFDAFRDDCMASFRLIERQFEIQKFAK